MQIQGPRFFVIDDDRAVLSLAGTGITCLDVLRALRSVSPQCEAVMRTGYASIDAAIEAVRESQALEGGAPGPPAAAADAMAGGLPAPLVDVQRDHIVRTLRVARGNKAVAARMLGVSRRAFYRQLERHGLHRRVPTGRHAAVAQLTSE